MTQPLAHTLKLVTVCAWCDTPIEGPMIALARQTSDNDETLCNDCAGTTDTGIVYHVDPRTTTDDDLPF